MTKIKGCKTCKHNKECKKLNHHSLESYNDCFDGNQYEEKILLALFEGGIREALEHAISNGCITVLCPYCGTRRTIEPDGFYDDVECNCCHKHYRTEGVC